MKTTKEKKQLQNEIDELKRKVLYAQEFTPHKLGYYNHLLTLKINELI